MIAAHDDHRFIRLPVIGIPMLDLPHLPQHTELFEQRDHLLAALTEDVFADELLRGRVAKHARDRGRRRRQVLRVICRF